MKQKIFGIAALVLILGGCASIPKVKFDTLDSRKFVLTSVSFAVYNKAYQNTIDEALVTLPIAEVINKLEQKYGITIDANFFADKNAVKTAIKQAQVKTSDGNTTNLPIWVAAFESDALQNLSLDFILLPTSGDLQASAITAISDGEKTTNQTQETIEIEPWALFEEKTDRQNAAVLEIGKHLDPGFVNGNSYKVFYKNNSAGKKAIYLSPNTEHDISFTIKDPGIFMIYDAVTISNMHWKGSLEPAKKYTLNYKIDRTGSYTNWTVSWELTEEK